jgi:hypothetical protein
MAGGKHLTKAEEKQLKLKAKYVPANVASAAPAKGESSRDTVTDCATKVLSRNPDNRAFKLR